MTSRRAVALTVAVLAFSNVMSNRVLPASAYVPWNLAVAVALVTVARWRYGLGWTDLGMARRDLATGVRWGLVLAVLVVAVYLVALANPDLRDVFRDRRVGSRSGWEVLAEAAVRIPLGTVVLEEVGFRGVLLGQLRRQVGPVKALLVAAVAFGLWHVLPAWNVSTVNPTVARAEVGRLTAVASAVVATTIAGVVMGWARLRSRHLAAPAALHVATNSVGFVLAWLVLRHR